MNYILILELKKNELPLFSKKITKAFKEFEKKNEQNFFKS